MSTISFQAQQSEEKILVRIIPEHSEGAMILGFYKNKYAERL